MNGNEHILSSSSSLFCHIDCRKKCLKVCLQVMLLSDITFMYIDDDDDGNTTTAEGISNALKKDGFLFHVIHQICQPQGRRIKFKYTILSLSFSPFLL